MEKSVTKKNFLNQCFESPAVGKPNDENSSILGNGSSKAGFLINDSIETTPLAEKTNTLSSKGLTEGF